MSSHRTRTALRFVRWTAVIATSLLAPRAEAVDYVVSDEASCESFLAGIGAEGSWLGDLCYVDSGALPESDHLLVTGVSGLRPQTGTFTNLGEIEINATAPGRGFYGAGTFVNEGTFHVVAGEFPENYATIRNSGTFTTDIDFGNYGSFSHDCDATITGTILGNAVMRTPDLPCDFVVSDEASCEAFLAGIGATGSWLGDLCYVNSGTLLELDHLLVTGVSGIRPQSGTFTNQGEIEINVTAPGRGLYGAGTFVNEGTVHILAAEFPENYAAIRNSGTFTTDIDFGNYGTFTNDCGATINGTVVGNPVTNTPDQFPCGEAIDPAGVAASDALVVLRTAVGVAECLVCVCDVDASGVIAASDALAVLRNSVGQDVPLRCQCCETATTTTTITVP